MTGASSRLKVWQITPILACSGRRRKKRQTIRASSCKTLTYREAGSIIPPQLRVLLGLADLAGLGGRLVRLLGDPGLRFLRKLYEYWMAFGHAIGVVLTPIQLFLIYVLVFGPARLIALISGRDLLDRRMTPGPTFWHPKEPQPHTIESTRHQF